MSRGLCYTGSARPATSGSAGVYTAAGARAGAELTESATIAEADAPRRRAMGAFALASRDLLASRWAALGAGEEIAMLRGPEVGLVMVRGRVGGGGAPFNLGEASVTRASVRLSCGAIGHATILGRDPGRARLAAAFDALWSQPAHRRRVEAEVVEAALAAEAAADAESAEETEATRVDFFTVARGED